MTQLMIVMIEQESLALKLKQYVAHQPAAPRSMMPGYIGLTIPVKEPQHPTTQPHISLLTDHKLLPYKETSGRLTITVTVTITPSNMLLTVCHPRSHILDVTDSFGTTPPPAT